MEEHKKTREIHRVTQDDEEDRCQVDNIPLDLTLDMLSRLPPKSIARFLCVSKLWSSFTTLPSFINSFASRSSSQPPRLLLTFTHLEAHTSREALHGSYPPYHSYHMPNPKYSVITLSESVQGLILLKDLVLPQPQETISVKGSPCSGYRSYLGYDPLEGKHKVLFMSRNEYTDQPRVLTLGAQESWRIITKGRCPMHFSSIGGYGRCFNGILYYEAFDTDGHRIIMSFDVKYENFNLIKILEGFYKMPCHMILYEGRLALVHKRTYDPNVDLYILNDSTGDEWLHEECCLHILAGLCLNGVTAAGELVFTSTENESLYILYLNPRRNMMREALFEGIVGGDFRSRYGLCSNIGI
ncbi:hypothetical protein BRARA_H02011 [Brassica rapa]|uniref:Uncharacterized protein n=1 Tax=Brassica campestris TaxID=3711 RepID=A0A397YD11_BRACM|nr:hypothetical protein BRARA_H02011 [Brassica rapa]